jgi:murein DD-endopeptidase MepM/ murein hydrolase activator NlpD
MKAGVAGILFALAAACAMPSSADPQEQQVDQTQSASQIIQQDLPPAEPAVPSVQTQAPPTGTPLPSEPFVATPVRTNRLECSSVATQGGAIVCRTEPGARLSLDSKPVAIADAAGIAIIGLSRTQQPIAVVRFNDPPGSGLSAERERIHALVDVRPRTDTVSTLTMECNKIAAQTPEEKRHAEVSWVKKDKAFKVFSQPIAPLALMKPAEGRYSSPFGATRTYVPKTKDCEGSTNVHNGQDIAIPTGAEIRAPMAGTVVLADPDLYYEGGAVFLDLGHGLLSITMHMSRVDVKAGETVGQGQLLGLSGATGRVTGPHLHWALKARNELRPDDRNADIWLDPVLMLELQQPTVSAP